MSISSFYARNMLRQRVGLPIKGVQLPVRTKSALFATNVVAKSATNVVTSDLSADMKRKIIVERVAREIFETLLFTENSTPIVEDVRQTLNQSFGEELGFYYDPDNLELLVVRETVNGEEELTPARRARVLDKAWELSMEKVESSLL